MADDAITVTQADIDAVKRFHEESARWLLNAIKNGDPIGAERDLNHPIYQAFARHRTTSLAAQHGLVDALKVAFWASIQNANSDHKYLDFDSLDEIITAAWTGFEDAALSAIRENK